MVTISNRQRKVKLNLREIERDSRRALRSLGLQRAELSLLFASPALTRSLNRDYRGVDRTTDVLSFPIYSSPGEFPPEGGFLLGDIVINPQLAASQARELGHTLGAEIRRLLVHGLLHLMGHGHEGSDYQRRKMRRLERELLEGLG
jgi:rRNA maturation RNase YbeY